MCYNNNPLRGILYNKSSKNRGGKMAYKEIIREIESYENKFREAFFIYGEHGKTDAKKRNLEIAKNRKDAATSALFDFCRIYRDKKSPSANEYFEEYCKALEDRKLILENDKEALGDLEGFERIYKRIVNKAMSLEGKDFLKLIKYGNEKRNEHIRRDIKLREKENKQIVNNLTDVVVSNYKKYLEEKRERENRVFHVGTSKEEKEAYNNLITTEEVKYTLIYKAIEDALKSADESILISNELVLYCYERIENFPLEKERYEDDKAYELAQNGYEVYNDAFNKTYGLNSQSKKKLKKKLDSKLKIKGQ